MVVVVDTSQRFEGRASNSLQSGNMLMRTLKKRKFRWQQRECTRSSKEYQMKNVKFSDGVQHFLDQTGWSLQCYLCHHFQLGHLLLWVVDQLAVRYDKKFLLLQIVYLSLWNDACWLFLFLIFDLFTWNLLVLERKNIHLLPYLLLNNYFSSSTLFNIKSDITYLLMMLCF